MAASCRRRAALASRFDCHDKRGIRLGHSFDRRVKVSQTEPACEELTIAENHSDA